MSSADVVRQPAGLRLCICTPDYVHLVKNGGIGTSFQHTASVIGKLGLDVTILYSNTVDAIPAAERKLAQARVEREGAKLEFLLEDDVDKLSSQFFPTDIYTVSSYLAYQWLKARSFDIVLFADWRGLAYYSVHAKVQGLAFAQTELWIQAHSTQLWHDLNNERASYTELDVRIYHLERKSIELCDRLLCATDYLRRWMLEFGFKLPTNTEVLPYLIEPSLFPARSQADSERVREVKEIVFFGRLEKRKGIHIFLQALQRLAKYHPERVGEGLEVTFLGKIANVDGVNSVEYIDRALKGLGFRYTVNPSLSSEESVKYLSSRPVVAVMPSLTDNSPLTVHECMYAGIPFLACATGGIPEIIASEDHGFALCEPTVPALADRLTTIMRDGQRVARPSVDQQADNIPRWLAATRDARRPPPPEPQPADPLVTICVTHYERPRFLRKTLEGLRAQTYRNFEVVVVDNGSLGSEAGALISSLEDAYADLNLRVFKLPDLYPGAARNVAIEQARGEYVLVMDDDNYALPHQVETFVRAMERSGYDALSCVLLAFPDEETPPHIKTFVHMYLPTGSGLSLNLFGNSYGDANGIFRRSSLLRIGGYTEERSSWEDYELYLKLEQNGFKVGVVPEPLLLLRHTKGGASRIGAMIGNYYRALRPALKGFPWGTYGDALLVALTPSMRLFDNLRFGPDAPADDREIMDYAGEPLVISRLLARRTYQTSGVEVAAEQLDKLAASGSSLAALSLDAFFARASDQGPQFPVATESGSPVGVIAEALRMAMKVRSFAPLLAIEADVGALAGPDLNYLFGLAEIASGDPIVGMTRWRGMLADADAEYLRRNADIRAAVKAGDIRCGVQHYMEYGQAEDRLFAYRAPLRAPFAVTSAFAPENYLARLHGIAHLGTGDARRQLRSLVLDIIKSGCVVAACDIGDFASRQAERRYLDENPDVAAGLQRSDFKTAHQHWSLHGREEGDRSHLTGSLADDGLFEAIVEAWRSGRADRQATGGGLLLSGSVIESWVERQPRVTAAVT